jgi:hypothetical protein
MPQMLWTCCGIHPIFIYVCIKMQMLFTLWKPCVMFPLNFLALLLQLSFLWRCHLWYLLPLLPLLCLLWSCHLWYFCSLFGCLYHCWHCRWFYYAPHHFLCPRNLCSPIPSSFLSLKFLLLKLRSSF